MTLNEIMDIALANNKEINAYALKVKEIVALKATAFDPDKTVLSYGYDQNNITPLGYPLHIWGISQDLSFPTLYFAERNARMIDVSRAELALETRRQSLQKNVSLSFYTLKILQARQDMYRSIDSLYSDLLRNAESRFAKGDYSQLRSPKYKSTSAPG